jgi:hypothetical protein
MTRLALDSLSAKTLPHLDTLYREGRRQKLRDILRETPAAPLRRLTLAAVARHTELMPPGSAPSTEAARKLEELIGLNLAGAGERVNGVLSTFPIKPAPGRRENAEVELLVTSIARWAVVGC